MISPVFSLIVIVTIVINDAKNSFVKAFDVTVEIPETVQEYGTVNFVCNYDLEDSPLYSVKWYRGNYEFFRYQPGEIPPAKFFSFSDYVHPGIKISLDLEMSNAHQVVLTNVTRFLSGVFTCEVTTDEPYFITSTASSVLKVQTDNNSPSNLRNPMTLFPINIIGPPNSSCSIFKYGSRYQLVIILIFLFGLIYLFL